MTRLPLIHPPMTILVVEDNALIAMTLEAALSDAGYTVLGTASSVERAVEIAMQTSPQLALLNIHLRNGGSGIELARRLKKEWGTAVVFVTGQPPDACEHKDLAIGVLSKPCTDETLLATVRIAERIIAGEKPDRARVPKGLEIF